MKIRAYTISWLLIAFMFMAAGSYAVAADVKTQDDGVKIAYFDNSTRDFSVDITFVGTTTLPGDDLGVDGSEGGMDVYNYVTNTAVPFVNVKFNYSGLITVNGSDAAGQAFVISNNFFKMATSGLEWTSSGFGVPLKQGDNFISVLYIAVDDNGAFSYAYDTVIVRVRSSDADLSNVPTYKSFPVDFGFVDEAVNATTYPLDYPAYDYNDPVMDLSFTSNGTDMGGQTFGTSALASTGVDVSGMVNSTGTVAIDADQLNGTDAVEGMSFFVDDYGIHPIASGANATFKTYASSSDAQIGGESYFGIATFAPNGIFTFDYESSDAEATYFSEFGASVADTSFFVVDETVVSTTVTETSVTSVVSNITETVNETTTVQQNPINAFAVGFAIFSMTFVTYVIRRKEE